ncbi:DDE-type integrase/transposase/recombinase [Candidatus Falkowbacteria bacterium]|nr:DDE-type integrase/transposase/recombinase [Candidatus Falkowbacteria bacterium]
MKRNILDACIERNIKCKDGAKLLKMHAKAFSRLKARYIREGEGALIPKKTGPKNFTPFNRTPEDIVEKVKAIAIKRPDLGPINLAEELFTQYDVELHPTTVWRILKREKVRYTTEYKRWKQEPKLYCLDTPGEELQLDGCYPFSRSRKIVHFDALDDCSRWVFGRLYDRETADNAIDFVKHLIRSVPFKIQRIRVDNRYGKKFVEFCNSLGIEVIENEPYMPQQNGKIERFHKTLKREFYWKYCAYNDSVETMKLKYIFWQNYYNTKRKHQGYGMKGLTPQQKIASTLLLSLTNIYPQKVTLTLQQYIV